MKAIKSLFLITICWAVVMLVPSPGLGAEVQKGLRQLLDQKTENLSVRSDTILNGFFFVLQKAHLPGGMIIDSQDENNMKLDLAFPAGDSFKDALDRIVDANSHFQWRIEGNAVLLLPAATGVPQIFDTRISRFDFEDMDNRSLMVWSLFHTPEVQNRMSELGLALGFIQTGLEVIPLSKNKQPPKRSIHLIDVTLMEALNLIVQKRGEGFWVYEEFTSSGKRYVTVTFVR